MTVMNEQPPITSQPDPPPAPPREEQPRGEGAEQYKAIAIIGYIIPLLFFIPLLSDAKKNRYALFHANQQLNLLLWWVIGQVAGSILMVVLVGILVLAAVYIGGLVFMVMGIINAANGSMKPLPLIGKIQLLK